MDVAIRQLDAAELDLVAGGGVGADLVKVAVGLIGGLAGGPILAAAGVALTIVTQAALNEPAQPWVDTGWTD
jgi:hypothetical protein